jgi:hypothetical protein
MNTPLSSCCCYRDYADSRQHSDDHEQSLQERLSRVVRSDLHRKAPRKNPASCLILPEPRNGQAPASSLDIVEWLTA